MVENVLIYSIAAPVLVASGLYYSDRFLFSSGGGGEYLLPAVLLIATFGLTGPPESPTRDAINNFYLVPAVILAGTVFLQATGRRTLTPTVRCALFLLLGLTVYRPRMPVSEIVPTEVLFGSGLVLLGILVPGFASHDESPVDWKRLYLLGFGLHFIFYGILTAFFVSFQLGQLGLACGVACISFYSLSILFKTRNISRLFVIILALISSLFWLQAVFYTSIGWSTVLVLAGGTLSFFVFDFLGMKNRRGITALVLVVILVTGALAWGIEKYDPFRSEPADSGQYRPYSR